MQPYTGSGSDAATGADYHDYPVHQLDQPNIIIEWIIEK